MPNPLHAYILDVLHLVWFGWLYGISTNVIANHLYAYM